jgi:hypothetical protein
MCFRRKPISWEHSNKVALLFGINDYPGSSNDLNGCLNDLETVREHLPDFQMRIFRDREVTGKCFKDQVLYAFQNAVAGDVIYIHYSGHGSFVPDKNNEEIDGYDECLYLYDGPLIDDETGQLFLMKPEGVVLIVAMDCCYSGTNTRFYTGSRFYPPKKYTPAYRRIKRAFRSDMNYILLSACTENETSSDALINNTWQGAFTFYAFSCLSRNLTYRKWYDLIQLRLPNKNFDQQPQLEGSDELLDRLVFQ